MKVNSATNCRRVRATNCAARLPAVMNRVVAGSNCAATRNRLRIERPAQPFVRADEDHRALANFAHLQQRMGEIAGVSRSVPLDAIQQLRERPRHQRACCALRIFDAATICIARVICAVLVIDLMRRRIHEG